MSRREVPVVAAVIRRGDHLLLSRRPDGTHLEGLWEFPGGKVEPGESDAEALVRELREELGVKVSVGARLEEVVHAYPEKTVHLRFYACTLESGTPRPLEVAEVRWWGVGELDPERFPPADRPLLERLMGEGRADRRS